MRQEEEDREEYSRLERTQMAKNSFKMDSRNRSGVAEEEVYGIDLFLKSAKSFFLRSLFALFFFGIIYGMKQYNSTPLGVNASNIKKAVESRDDQEALETWVRSLR